MWWTAGIETLVFNDATLSFSKVSFELRACTVHLGEGATCGHYRALLTHEGNEVGFRYCDDGCKSEALRTFDDVSSDVCLLFLVSWSVKFSHRISLEITSCRLISGLQVTIL